MGKILILKGSDFSANAVNKVEIIDGQIFYSPFNTNAITNVSQQISAAGSQYMFNAGGKCLGFMLPIVFSDETTVVVKTTNAYSGKTIEDVDNVVGALYCTSMDLTDADITKIPMSTSLVDLSDIKSRFIKANTSNTIAIPSDAKGAVLYLWVNDSIGTITSGIFNAIISTILVK